MAFAGTLLMAAWFEFGGGSRASVRNYPLEFLLIPLLLWGATRLGRAESATATLVLSVLAVYGTLHDFGPFHLVSENASLLVLQGFMSVISVTTLVLATAVEERRLVEEDLRWAHSGLQLKVLERTEELQKSNLLLEREMRKKEILASELLESNEMFHLLSESTQEGVVIASEGSFIGANSAFCRIFGYEHDEVIGLSAEVFVTPDCRDEVRSKVAQGYDRTYGVHGMRKDGSKIDLEVTGKDIHREGRTLRVTAIRDVTERNRKEEELRRLALLVETSTDFICMAALDGHMIYVNGGGRRLVGLGPEEDISAKLHQDFIAPRDVPRLMQEVIASLVDQGHWEGEFQLRHFKSGASIPFHFTSVLIQDPATGQPQAMAAIGRDITQRKRMEELARSNQELEQFAYVASHDLQEPLRMVTSFTQLLARENEGRLGAESDQYIRHIVDGTDRMRSLIRDLLAYSRVNSAGEPFVEVDCAKALGQALSNLEVSLKEDRAEVSQGPLPSLQGDFNQVVQLFQNLIGNAVKFHGSDPPGIRVEAEQKGKEWVFSVQDNGIGIEPQYVEKIFEVFKRLHSRSDYPGTGIGLAICKKVVARHGGRIWVESEPGRGSTFYWTFPCLKEVAREHETVP